MLRRSCKLHKTYMQHALMMSKQAYDVQISNPIGDL